MRAGWGGDAGRCPWGLGGRVVSATEDSIEDSAADSGSDGLSPTSARTSAVSSVARMERVWAVAVCESRRWLGSREGNLPSLLRSSRLAEASRSSREIVSSRCRMYSPEGPSWEVCVLRVVMAL